MDQLKYDKELLNTVEQQLIVPLQDGTAELNSKIPAGTIIGTHDGMFHADEVLALALLRLQQPELKWIRTRNPEVLAGTLRVDVDEGLLDHHGSRAESGVAACSRVYALLLQSGLIPEWDQAVLEPIVAIVAAWDTGDDSQPHPVAYVHALASAAIATGGDMDAAFGDALFMVERHLKALLESAAASWAATAAADAAIKAQPDAAVVVFEPECRAADVKQLLYAAGHPATYYVSPESAADWRVLCCAPAEQHYSPFASKMLIPERFRGLRGAALAEAAGLPSDCGIFCHAAGFIAGFKTCDAAVKFAEICVNNK